MNLLAAQQSLIVMSDLLGLDAGIFPAEIKSGRDQREPGWREKQAAEKALFLTLQAFFEGQRQRIHNKVHFAATVLAPPVAIKSDPLTDALDDAFWQIEDTLLRGKLVDFVARSARAGVRLNAAWTTKRFSLVFDETLTNTQATAWARKYSAQLVTQINKKTRASIRESVANWIETPGTTLRDLMDQLPFNERRSMLIATTETTAAYANGEKIFTDDLQSTYPSLKIVRIWATNNDDRVCPACEPLNGKQIRVGQQFRSDGEMLDGPPRHPNCRCWTLRDVIT